MRHYRLFGYRKRHRRIKKIQIFAFVLLSVLTAVIIENRLPFIQKGVLPTAMNRFAQEKLADTVPEFLSEATVWQEDETIVPDTYYLNGLKAALIQELQEQLSGKTVVWIPIGNLTGAAVLNGRGLKIPLKYAVSGTVDIEFVSALSGTGINRTKYSVVMEIRVELISISSNISESVTVQSNYLVYESVTDGAVPLDITK